MKIIYANNAMVVKTDISAVDFAAAEKFAPESLKVRDEKGNDLFAVGKGAAQLKPGYATFNAVVDGKMAVTVPLEMGLEGEDAKEVIKDKFAQALAALATNEPKIVTQITAALAPIQAVVEDIEVQ